MTLAPSAAPCANFGRDFDRIPVAGILRIDAAISAAVTGVPNAADPRRGFGGAAYQAGDAPSAIVHADRQHLDAIVVHQGRRVGARQHQGCRAVIRQHQHLPVRSAAHSARDPLAVARGREAVRTLDRLAVAHHGGQALG